MAASWENLSDPIFHHAQTRPDAPAVIEGPSTLSYRELAALIAKATVYLRDLGIGEGDRIGLALTNSADHIILAFALWRIGATLAELSVEDKPEALAATAARCGIGTIFTEAHAAAPPGLRRIRVDLGWRERIAHLGGDHRSAAAGRDLLVIMLTTGSTGIPRAWTVSHRGFMDAAEMREAWWLACGWDSARERGHFLLMNSLRFCWFQTLLVLQARAGAPLVLLPEYAKPADMLRAIAGWPDAVAYVTANICRYMLSVAPASGTLLPNVRWLESGGLPLYPEEKQAMVARVTPRFNETYGSTGGGFISALSGRDMATKSDTVGRPPPRVEVQIVDSAGRPVPVGMPGELRCRPLWALPFGSQDAVTSGERIVDGWCYTADVGFFDAEGYIHLRGRGADVIRRGAVEIFAPEIEAVLAAHPAIAEAAVIGLRRAGQTEREEIVAFIVKRGEFDHADLVRHCRERLPPAQQPDRVYYADMLPRIAGGKLNRIRLEELAVEAEARQPGRRS
jgi:long-chain acyl-CoA synthetase